MALTCEGLFEGMDARIIGDADAEVRGLAYRSDAVRPGDAFFCIVGLKVDGHEFAQDAIDAGASVIVAQRNIYNADTSEVTIVIVDDTRKAMAEASCNLYGHPSRSFDLVGITGTNGKTTTTYLVETIGRHLGLKTGVIGTVGIRIGDEFEPSGRTTPESPDLQRILARMRDAGCQLVAMEVSSHALDLKRTWGCEFAVTAFTNLTQDHLDYHRTFEEYYEAKALLFGPDYPAKRVVGTSTDWGRRLARECREPGSGAVPIETSEGSLDVMTYGFDGSDSIHPVDVEYSSTGTVMELDAIGEDVRVESPLVGRFNVENSMCAFGIGRCLGIGDDELASALSDDCSVPGRLERVTIDVPDAVTDGLPTVYVDYAHTPDALAKAISSVKGLASGRTIVVFGCGGDRDREKRPLMGEAALAADVPIVTSDNPRTESPGSIISDIVAGMGPSDAGDAYEVIEDRAQAIAHAVSMADEGDIVLIAGKGHEDYQETSTGRIHFDDREEARNALTERIEAFGSADASGGPA